MKRSKQLKFSTVLAISLSTVITLPFIAHALSGAIFTTTDDGSIVNENVRYGSKLDVYLDGGPKVNAPASAAALPDGNYYFQVTDPSGKDLLSRDHISCREVTIENGVITEYPGMNGTNYVRKQGSWQEVSCTEYPTNGKNTMTVHMFNDDVDHGGAPLNAKVIQLYPYDDTPNPGGVYKAWMTPVEEYTLDSNYVPSGNQDQANNENYQPGNYHGFVPRHSKTDNYKVKERKPQFGIIALRNYHDANLNCRLDAGENFIWRWEYGITDGVGARNGDFTADESSGDPTTILMQEALGQLNDLWKLDHYRWTESQDKNNNSQYFTTSGYVHEYLPFTSTNAGPEDPALWDGDLASDYIARFLMKMICPQANDISAVGVQLANEFAGFTPADLGVVASTNNDPQIAITLGDVGFANIMGKKVFDINGDGMENGNDFGLQGWKIRLTYAPTLLQSGGGPVPDTISKTLGMNAALWDAINTRYGYLFPPTDTIPDPLIQNGQVTKMTDANGEVTFKLLLPNGYAENVLAIGFPSDFYMIEEATGSGWISTSAEYVKFDVRSEASGTDGRLPPIMGNVYDEITGAPISEFTFTNYCFNEASFGTKGYWHNKNGLDEMEEAFVTGYVNTLDPYDSMTSYFGAGDEPFDGFFMGGAPVAPAYKNDKVIEGISAGAGTPKAEVSHFLIDSNGGGDPREQLAQQLLAFIFNVEYRLGGDATLMKPGGGTILASDLILASIAAWQGTDATSQNNYKTLLDTFNNMKIEEGNGVKYIPNNPDNCPAKPDFD